MRSPLLILVLAGCAAAPPVPQVSAEVRAQIEANEAPFRVPGTVTARLREEVRLGGHRVRPLAVLEDSRCPVDVTCVWAGRIRLRVAVNGAEEAMELNRPVEVAPGQRLTLAAIAPPKWSRTPPGIDPKAPQRFAFRLSGMD